MIVLRRSARFALVAALVVAALHTAGGLFAGPSVRGLTLVISPSILLVGQPTLLSIRAIDSNAHAVTGVAVTITGANIPARRFVTGSETSRLLLAAGRKSPLHVLALRSGYRSITASVTVVAPRPPAVVTVLSPSVGVRAIGVSLYHPAKHNDPLFFQWHARTDSRQRGALTFADGSVLDLDRNTEVRLKDPTRTFLQTGQVFVQVVSGGQSHDVETGTSVAASLGTRYLVQVRSGITTVTVLSGRVSLRLHNHSVSIGANQQSSVSTSRSPSSPVHVQSTKLLGWTSGLPNAQGSASPRKIFFTRTGGSVLSIFSVDQQKVIASQRLPANATDIGFSSDGKYVLLATSAGLYRVVQATGKLEGLYLHGQIDSLAALPVHRVVAAAPRLRSLEVIDSVSGKLLSRISLGYAPTAVAGSPQGGVAAATGSGQVSLVDLLHRTIITTRPIGVHAGKPAFSRDGAVVVVPVGDHVVTFSVSARGLISSVPISHGGAGAVAVAAGPSGLAYVANASTKAVDVVNLATGKRIASYPVAIVPRSLVLADDGKLFVVSDNPGALVEIDPTDGFILGHVSVIGGGLAIAPAAPTAPSATSAPVAGSPNYGTLIVSSVPIAEAIPVAPISLPVSTQTATPAVTATLTPSPTLTSTSTATRLPTSTSTFTFTPTPSTTPTPSQTSTSTPTPTATPVPVSIVEFDLANPRSSPAGIVEAPDAAMWFAEQGAAKVGRFDTTTGHITGPIQRSAAFIPPYMPHDGTIAPDGSIWFTDVGKDAVVQYTVDPKTGSPAPVALLALAHGAQPDGIVTANGGMYVAEPGVSNIRAIVRPTGIWTLGGAVSTTAPPQRLALGADGNIWFSERNTGLVGRLNPVTSTLTEFSYAGARPTGIASGPDGKIWFADGALNQIVRIDLTGTVLNVYAIPTAFAGVTGVAAGQDGRIWFTEFNSDKLGSIDPGTGAVREYALGTRPAGPAYVTAGPPLFNGHHTMWFTETLAGKIGYAEVP